MAWLPILKRSILSPLVWRLLSKSEQLPFSLHQGNSKTTRRKEEYADRDKDCGIYVRTRHSPGYGWSHKDCSRARDGTDETTTQQTTEDRSCTVGRPQQHR